MNKNGRLTGKVALITGSTRGIGEQLAYGFAREGAKIAVTGRNQARGEAVALRIREEGGVAHFFPIDLTNEQSVSLCMQEAAKHFGALHVLVNNAAPTDHVSASADDDQGNLAGKVDGPVTDISTADWRKVMTAGLDGLFWVLKYAIPVMRDSGGGSIINISSIASLQGVGATDAYTASKGAMNAMTRSIAVNYAKDNIRCNCLVAGAFDTDASKAWLSIPAVKQAFLDTMLARDVAPPSAMVPPALMFASDESWYITGQIMAVDGGLTIKMPVPRLEAQ
jgi:NAD(P)-dependent dehydrogenase (short-subunit alcohol dehydrogenase family)